ncbi:MAG: rhomboid family intramembrane serine protease [Bacteroidetes bacterium]|nr:rhomboid family intramembrane serine protease [Bacteroidota bacterium]
MITYALLILNIIFSLFALNNDKLMRKYMFHPYSIYHLKEHYRFLSHAFIHGSYIHLIFNMLALYSFGIILENQYFPYMYGEKLGEVYYLILYTGGIYVASFTEYFRQKNNPGYSSLGASGAISSILFAFIMISPVSRISFFFFPLQGWIAGILLLGVSFFLIKRKRSGKYNDGISHESHFWGALFGVAFVLITQPASLKNFIHQIQNAF